MKHNDFAFVEAYYPSRSNSDDFLVVAKTLVATILTITKKM